MRGALLASVAWLAWVACSPVSEYLCSTGPECGAAGTCEADGHCSFVDNGCPSGRRYGEHGGSLAGTCVSTEAPDGSPGPPGPDGSGGTGCVQETGTGRVEVQDGVPSMIVADLSCANDDSVLCGGSGRDRQFEFDLASDQVVWITAQASGGTAPSIAVSPGACGAAPALACYGNPCGDLGHIAIDLPAGPNCLTVDQASATHGLVSITLTPTGRFAEPLAAGELDYYDTCFDDNDWMSVCTAGVDDLDVAYYTVLCAGSYQASLCPEEPWPATLATFHGPALTPQFCGYGNNNLECPGGTITSISLAATTLVFTVVDGIGDCGPYDVVLD